MLVSVILPVYNAEKTIQFSIESVLNQSHQELEILAIINGCTDGTEELIRQFKDDRIKILYSEKGRVPARNLGLIHAKGNLIALQDSDDEWLQDKLRLQVEELSNDTCDIIGTHINYVDTNRILLDKNDVRPTEHDQIIQTMLNGWNCLANASVVFRKSLINNMGTYDECFPICEDYHLWLRGIKFARFKNLKQKLLNYMSKHDPNYDPVIPNLMSQFYRLAYGRMGIIK